MDEPRRYTLHVRGGVPSARTRLGGENELGRLFVRPHQLEDGHVQARAAVVHQQGATDRRRRAIHGVSVLIAVVRMVALHRLAVIARFVTRRPVGVMVTVVVTVPVVVAMLDVAAERAARMVVLIGTALMGVDDDGCLAAEQAGQRQQRDQEGG